MFRCKSYFTVLVGALAALLVLSGCAGSPYLDSHFGDSMHAAVAQQTLHPDAWRNTDPVSGLDGRAADGAYESYLKSYKMPEPQQNVFLIGGQGR